jgi:hypothetical protein
MKFNINIQKIFGRHRIISFNSCQVQSFPCPSSKDYKFHKKSKIISFARCDKLYEHYSTATVLQQYIISIAEAS